MFQAQHRGPAKLRAAYILPGRTGPATLSKALETCRFGDVRPEAVAAPLAGALDLLETLRELEARRVSLAALSGMTFDLASATGRMMATMLAGISEFERAPLRGPGLAAAKARGKLLGRQPGQRPKFDRLARKVLALVDAGRSYRPVGRELGLSKNTVADIVKQRRALTAGSGVP